MITKLEYRETEYKGWYILTRALHFVVTIAEIHAISPAYARDLARKTGLSVNEDIVITVPEGFLTDLASIPSIFHGIAAPDGPWKASAVIHDFLYQLRPRGLSGLTVDDPHARFESYINRFIADRIFYLAMRYEGVDAITAASFFNGVRAGGGRYFQKKTDAPEFESDTLFRMAEPYQVCRSIQKYGIPDEHKYTLSGEPADLKYPNHGRPIYFSKV